MVENARKELVSGSMDYGKIGPLDSTIMNAVIPSVEKYGEDYIWEYSKSGDPEKFATGIMLDRPNLKWANGIGKSYTIPVSIMLLEDAKKYPTKTRSYMEKIACTLLPKATGKDFGINGLSFVDSDKDRAVAIEHWHQWYQANKQTVLEADQRANQAVEAQIGQQKKFIKGVMDLNKSSERLPNTPKAEVR